MTLIFFFVFSRFTVSISKTVSKLRDFASMQENRMTENDIFFE